MKNNYDIKEKIVKSGGSKILKNWQQLCGWNDYSLTEGEFLEALKWVCEDPIDEYNRLTREIGLTKKGIVKLKRVWDKGLCLMYHIDTKELWGGDCFKTPCDNPDFAPNGFYVTNYKISLSAIEKI